MISGLSLLLFLKKKKKKILEVSYVLVKLVSIDNVLSVSLRFCNSLQPISMHLRDFLTYVKICIDNIR
jgi:hypothetical protein